MLQNFDSGDRDHERWTLKKNYQMKERIELTSTYTQRCFISCENFFQSNRVFSFLKGSPGDADGKEYACSAGRPRFNPWVGKIPWRRERLPTPIFWSREFNGLYSPRGHKESDTTEQLSLHPKIIYRLQTSILIFLFKKYWKFCDFFSI